MPGDFEDQDYTSAQECAEARLIHCKICDDLQFPEVMHWVRDAKGTPWLVCQKCVDGENEYVSATCPLCAKGNGVAQCELCVKRVEEAA